MKKLRPEERKIKESIPKSTNYGAINQLFLTKQWDMNKLRECVDKKWITIDEFENITGQWY